MNPDKLNAPRLILQFVVYFQLQQGQFQFWDFLRILQRGTKLPMVFNVLRDPYEIGQLKLDFTMEIAIFLLSNWIHRENDTKEIASSCISCPRREGSVTLRGMKNCEGRNN